MVSRLLYPNWKGTAEVELNHSLPFTGGRWVAGGHEFFEIF